MRVREIATLLRLSRVLGLGWALAAWMELTPEMCRAEAPTTNAFALTMHATVVPEIHIVPPEERGAHASPVDPFCFCPDVRCEGKAACSNQFSFALHARNLTMLEAVDLICFLSETPYAFDGNRLVIGSTNLPAIELKQKEKQEKALIARLKGITIPEVDFRKPSTIVDLIEFLFHASADYDDPAIPVKRRGLNFAAKKPHRLPFREEKKPVDTLPIAGIDHWTFCTLYDTLTNVCEKVDARFLIRDNTVVICPAGQESREPGKGQ